MPETWLVYLLQLANDDPEMRLVEVAMEEWRRASPRAPTWRVAGTRCS